MLASRAIASRPSPHVATVVTPRSSSRVIVAARPLSSKVSSTTRGAFDVKRAARLPARFGSSSVGMTGGSHGGRRRGTGLVTRALFGPPPDPDALLAEGKALYLAGERMPGFKTFEKALRADDIKLETRQELLYCCMCCCAAFGDVETAKQYLRDMKLAGLPFEVAMVRSDEQPNSHERPVSTFRTSILKRPKMRKLRTFFPSPRHRPRPPSFVTADRRDDATGGVGADAQPAHEVCGG